jgi:hypothetical protein
MGKSNSSLAWVSLMVICTLSAIPVAKAAPQIVGFGPDVIYVGEHKTYRCHVSASGAHLTYQWWHQEPDAAQGHPIPVEEGFGSDRRQLVVTEAQLTRDYNGKYWCVVTSTLTGESVQSPKGEVFVIGPPAIIQHPQNQTVTEGSDVSFSVIADPHGPVAQKFQWFFNERALPGKTRPTLELNGVTARKAGIYSCRVKTIGGITMSGGAVLTVQ